MPATELVVTSLGNVGGKELFKPTSNKGNTFPNVQDWVAGKIKAGISVRDISTCCIVQGVKQWAVYEEPYGSTTLQTVFEIT
jgi:hypothetical protein